MGKNLRDVLRKPVVSEKSVALMEKGKYVFEVAPSASKIEVWRAVEKFFKVNVVAVHVLRVKGKVRRFRTMLGKTKERKKAIVSLRSGDKIELFE